MTKQVRKLVSRNSVVRVVLRDPEDLSKLKTDAARLLTTASGAVATYQVFDDQLAMTLREDADAASAGVFTLAGPGARKLAIGDRLWILEDSGTVFNSNITAVDLDQGTVTTAAALASKASKTKQVRRALLASPGSLAEFGTPAQGSDAWGFDAPVNPDLLGLLPLAYHRWSIEIYLKGDAVTGNLDRTFLLLGQFDEVEEA